MSSSEETKILRLDHSRTDRAFKEEESLWDNEIGRMRVLIDNHVQALRQADDEDIRKNPKEMPRLSIGIYGSPGSGKSSLVETFAGMVNDEKNSILKGLGGAFHSLPVIKPNALAKDEHFLYKFLAAALNEEKEKKSKKSPHRESSILSELEQKFQEVSQYLQVINEAEHKQDEDPLGVSLDRLDRHESEVKLVKEMGEFIDTLADSLGGRKKSPVIFMPVDDSDMSMDTLISALGTCWRYLQHPRLIPIFTFTGRLAEELLRVHFQEKLTVKGISFGEDKLKEASTQLLMTENMALQYLGKLFPVRNRIRMGPASARVLGAKYISPDYLRIKNTTDGNELKDQPKENEIEVLELLKVVSKLLFGHARVPIVPEIRPPLRMVTLRRQVQIVDAMQASGVERLIRCLDSKENRGKQSDERLKPDKSWGQLFDTATWSLLNTHRDILKEFRLNLDDLYSWTPNGMRQVVLDSILGMGLKERRKLIKHWRYRTEDRRSQIISLLATNVYRPRMAGEEPTGDKPGLIEKWPEIMKREVSDKIDSDALPVSKGLRWFISICIGFYIPQILACNRISKGAGSDADASDTGTISGIGWDFSSGPIHAVREAIGNNKVFSTGMLFLDPIDFHNSITKLKDESKLYLILYIYIWCFYGFKDGKPWVAVSLWRGLGLIGKLLKLVMDPGDVEFENNIKTILGKHLDSAMVVGSLPKGQENKALQNTNQEDTQEPAGEQNKEVTDRMDVIFKEWRDIGGEGDIALGEMSKLLIKWLDKFYLSGSLENKGTSEEKLIFPMLDEKVKEEEKWKKCFIRRLHGENFISIFWQDLENKYYKKRLDQWNLHQILTEWFSVLKDYWKDCKLGKAGKLFDENVENVGELLMDCPILKGEFKEEDNEIEEDEKALLERYKDSLKGIQIETLKGSIFEVNKNVQLKEIVIETLNGFISGDK